MKSIVGNILLVDDDIIVNKINTIWLERSSIVRNIHTALNGEEAIEFLMKQASGHDSVSSGYPEIIFLDINMPVMDGWEFLKEYRRLRQENKFPECKIYILTSSPNPDDEIRALKIPEVTGFFQKPISGSVVNVLND